MPALMPTDFTGTLAWIGAVADREADLASGPLNEIEATFAGFAGESHAGLTRPSDSRVLAQYERGTTIRNTRQFSIVSEEDLAAIAAEMGVADLDPSLIGASLVIRGIPDFTLIPPSSRLQFQSGTTLTIDMENRPCVLPGPVIERAHPGFGAKFKPAAEHRRGVTGWVEREGSLKIGDQCRLHIPDQPAWPHARAYH